MIRRGSKPASSSSPTATSASAVSSLATASSTAHPHLEVGAPEQRPDLLDVEGAVRDRLVEQREGVAHGSGGAASEDLQRFRLRGDAFLRTHPGEVTGDLVE